MTDDELRALQDKNDRDDLLKLGITLLLCVLYFAYITFLHLKDGGYI